MIRNITGIGEGHGPYISIHDGTSSRVTITFLKFPD